MTQALMHTFGPGEKRLFSRRNDCRSLLLSLVTVLGWSSGRDSRRRGVEQDAEIERLTGALDACYAEMVEAAESGGLDIDHLTPPELHPARLLTARAQVAQVLERFSRVEDGDEILARYPGVLVAPSLPGGI